MKYAGPFLIVHKTSTWTHTDVWIEMLHGRLEPYFNSESKEITVHDSKGKKLTIDDVEIPKYKDNYDQENP